MHKYEETAIKQNRAALGILALKQRQSVVQTLHITASLFIKQNLITNQISNHYHRNNHKHTTQLTHSPGGQMPHKGSSPRAKFYQAENSISQQVH